MAASIAHLLSHVPCWTSDAVLLERYLHQHDEAAFAALVARHGSMVLRLCRRILGDAHAAEDAFQATFLILARKACSLKQPEALPGWLYGVARRVALKARGRMVGRTAAALDETLLDPRPDPLTQLTAREGLDILDEEVRRLPAAQQSAFVLCCLEGHIQDEAARILGCTAGSIKGLLERGRRRLQRRLTRRGIALSAALTLMTVARDQVRARVPALLLQDTVRAALDGTIGSSAAELAHSVLQTMLLGKVAGVTTLVVVIALAASTSIALVYRGEMVETPEDKKPVLAATPEQARADQSHVRTDAVGDALPEGALLRLGTIRYRAGAGINHASLSPDGTLLATACESGITFFDLDTGKPRYLRESNVVNGFDRLGSTVAFSADGKQLVNVTKGGNLCFWDVATGKRLHVVGNEAEPPPAPRGGIAGGMIPPPVVGDPRFAKVWFPPKGENVIAGARHTLVMVVEPSTGAIRRRFQVAGELASVAADGKTLAVLEAKRSEVIFYDDVGKELRRFPHESKLNIVTMCQGGKRLVTVNEKGAIKIWDAATGRELRTLAGAAAKSATCTLSVVSIAADGNTLFAGTQGGDILRWDLRTTGQEQTPLRGHGWWVTGLFHPPQGQSLISVSWDNVIHHWNLTTGKPEAADVRYTCYVRVARSPDGRTIAATGYPGRLELWDARTGKRLRSFSITTKVICKLRFSPNGKQLALACSDARVRLWDVDKERVTSELKLPTAREPGDWTSNFFEGLAWSLDGRYLAASMRGAGLRWWDMTSGKEIGHATHGSAVAFSPDGKIRVSAGWNKKQLSFQDAATGAVLFLLTDDWNVIDDIAFSSDGKWLATSHHGGNVYLRDPQTGTVRMTLKAHRQVAWSVSFSPDSKWLASSGSETVRLWEVATGAEVLCRKGHQGRVYQAEFGPDGRSVLSSSADLTALLWDIRPRLEPGRERSLETLWADLAAEPVRAYGVIWELAADAKTASELLGKKLAPVRSDLDAKRLARLIGDLDSDDFPTRQKAAAELEKLGEQALPAYRKALESKPALEVRRRLEDLLNKAQRAWWDVSGERLRSLRAVEVLELAGTTEARKVLAMLAAGAEGARLTEESKAALQRLARRGGS